MRCFRLASFPGLLVAGALGAAETAPLLEPAIRPGVRIAVIEGRALRAFVPAAQAEALRPRVVRVDAIYAAMARDAGYVIRDRLCVLISDDVEDHNGYSTVIPQPLVQIELAPSRPASGIFTGADEFERTLVHEFAHHLSNDRNYGFRNVVDSVFGRVLPNDLLSLGVFYLGTPAHVTMPSFWHEGLAQWAETAYAPPEHAFAGRGRDSLSHMVWRLDADTGAIPDPSTWRPTFPEWPFGNRVYLYGLAYTRWLESHAGSRAGLWQVIAEQGRTWALQFDVGASETLGGPHARLLERARADLLTEQQAQLARLRRERVTTATRLTPPDCRVGAPAWLPGSASVASSAELIAAIDRPHDRPAQLRIAVDGTLHSTGRTAWAMSGIRAFVGGLIYAESNTGTNPWARSRIRIVHGTNTTTLSGDRLLMPDAAPSAHGSLHVTAIRLLPAGEQELVLGLAVPSLSWFGNAHDITWISIPTRGRPWSPAFRPTGTPASNDPSAQRPAQELCVVETDASGSRLVLIAIAEPAKRTVLATVRGRLLHPAWTADGAHVYVCADHSGVSNAYRIDLAKPGELVPVTNTIGGVVACVPGGNGELALVDHDARGPFIARISADPAMWPARVPQLELAWPAPGGTPSSATRSSLAIAARAAEAEGWTSQTNATGELPIHPYRGLLEVRPLFWTPTFQATPLGGLGVAGLAADPLFTHQFVGGLGKGGNYGLLGNRISGAGTPVAHASYVFAAHTVQIGGSLWQHERIVEDAVVTADGDEHPQVDRERGAEARVGTGLAGLHRRWFAYGAYGSTRITPAPYDERRTDAKPIISPPGWTGREDYLELRAGYDDGLLYPKSYAREDGDLLTLTLRHAGLGGERDGNRMLALGAKSIPLWPEQGVQVVLGGAWGWNTGTTQRLQRFEIGGDAAHGLPRGYPDAEAAGDHLIAVSGALRVPVWRPFHGFSTTPFAFRQLVLEGFYDAAKASEDRPGGNGRWWRSAGGELRGEWEIWVLRFAPGVGVAHQLNHRGAISVYASLDFVW